MKQEEVVELFEEFLNEQGQWQNFKMWLEEKGYKLEEIGMNDE